MSNSYHKILYRGIKTLLKLSPPDYFVIALALIIISSFFFPLFQFFIGNLVYLGILFIIIGIVLNMWSALLFRKGSTTIHPLENPTHLIIKGPYHISRNPMYLGMFLILLGSAILFGNLSGILISFCFLFLIRFVFIKPEERNLSSVFGTEFIAYKKKVREWI